MTIIKNDVKTAVDALHTAGHGYKFIGKQLGIKADTVKKYLRDPARNGVLPPKVNSLNTTLRAAFQVLLRVT